MSKHNHLNPIEFIEEVGLYKKTLPNGKLSLYWREDNIHFDFLEENRVYWEGYFSDVPMEAEYFNLINSQNHPNRFYGELGLKEASVIFLFTENSTGCECIIPYCREMKYVAGEGKDYFLCLGEKNQFTNKKSNCYVLYDDEGTKLFTGEKKFITEQSDVIWKALDAILK